MGDTPGSFEELERVEEFEAVEDPVVGDAPGSPATPAPGAPATPGADEPDGLGEPDEVGGVCVIISLLSRCFPLIVSFNVNCVVDRFIAGLIPHHGRGHGVSHGRGRVLSRGQGHGVSHDQGQACPSSLGGTATPFWPN